MDRNCERRSGAESTCNVKRAKGSSCARTSAYAKSRPHSEGVFFNNAECGADLIPESVCARTELNQARAIMIEIDWPAALELAGESSKVCGRSWRAKD
jgi:hypothetical protein